MVQTVLDTLNSQPDLITASSALGAAMTQLQQKKDEIQVMMENYSSSNVWRTVEKDNLLKVAIDETNALAKVIRAYAVSINDMNLHNRMNFSKVSIRTGGINNTLLRMKQVMDEAANLLPALGGFAYNDMRFAAFTQLYSGLHSKKLSPRNAMVDHKTLREVIKQEMKVIDDILEFQIDAILLVLKADNESFYLKYKNARRIIHYGGNTGPKGSPPQPDVNNV